MEKSSLKLRIYPNVEASSTLFSYFKARQYAYHLGISLIREAYDLRHEMIEAFPMHAKDFPYPKWKSKNFLSRLISKQKQEVLEFNQNLIKQRALKENQVLTKSDQIILSEQEKQINSTESKEPEVHPLSFLLEVPRCILTQDLDDYQKALNKAFKDIKEHKIKKERSGFPHFYSLYHQQTFRFQIDKPSTSAKHILTWSQNKIRLGDLVLRYKDPTKLPSKVPSLVTVSTNSYGQYFASFLTSEVRTYKDPIQQAKLKIRQANQKNLAILGQKENRQLGYDPNIKAEYFTDSIGFSFSISERDERQKMEAKLLRAARHLSKTQQRSRKNNTPASKRSLKAKKALNKVYLDRKNQKEDFQQKKTSVIASLYPSQARETLNVSEMREKSGKTQSRIRHDRSYKKFHLARSFNYVAMGAQRSLMAEKLLSIHGQDSILITLPKFERTTQCCSNCGEERLVVELGSKVWQCPYCQTIHIRDECASQNTLYKGFDESLLSSNKAFLKNKLTLTFPDLILSKKGYPIARVIGLDVGKRRRFITSEKLDIASLNLGEFEKMLLNKLSSFSEVKVGLNLPLPQALGKARMKVSNQA